MRHKKRDIIIDILFVLNILLTAITCWGFYKLYDTLEYVSKQAPIEYIETDDGNSKNSIYAKLIAEKRRKYTKAN
jgi:hypothetical protein